MSISTHGQAFDNASGEVRSGGALSVDADAINNQGGRLSGATTSIKSLGLDNTQGRITAATQLAVAAGLLTNAKGLIGTTSPAGQVTLDVADLNNTDGVLSAGSLRLTSTGSMLNAGGAIGAAQDVTISAGAIKIADDAAQKALTGIDAASTLAGLNTQVTTDKDTSGAIKKAWDGQKLQDEVKAQTQITAAFGSAAAKQVRYDRMESYVHAQEANFGRP